MKLKFLSFLIVPCFFAASSNSSDLENISEIINMHNSSSKEILITTHKYEQYIRSIQNECKKIGETLQNATTQKEFDLIEKKSSDLMRLTNFTKCCVQVDASLTTSLYNTMISNHSFKIPVTTKQWNEILEKMAKESDELVDLLDSYADPFLIVSDILKKQNYILGKMAKVFVIVNP